MPNRKIAIVDANNVVAGVIIFNGDDISEQSTIAGLLSNPQSFEVDPYSPAVAGWKYIDGIAQESQG